MAARDALPVLTAGTPVLARTDRRIHVGSDPRTALVIDVPPAVTIATVVAVLQRLRTPQRFLHLRRAVRSSGLTVTGFWAIVDQLVSAGKAVPPSAVRQLPLRVGVVGHGELAGLLLTELPHDGYAAVPYDPAILFRSGEKRPNLVVIADQPVPDPTLWEPLVAGAVPHLSTYLNDDVGVVGPLVLPGLSSCLRCVDLYRADLDEHWPMLAATLHGVAGAAAPATGRATAAIAAAQIAEIAVRLRNRTADPPSITGRILEFRSSPSTVTSLPAPVHPRCDCQLNDSVRHGSRTSTILDHAAKGLN
ncbi:hypothetical protein [Gordonia phthalatica]|uniref:Bacteriocin biosynthesis cyclodehydratase domain-containing protein n=1 Tax=Gordonia phthalatica TaxID=1136941 RepID=A0A0N9MRD0_9ACTN|nr:hypothetical protein [Gordonia phthalatica]ALG85546.1 hypothetical protein ACH46_15030 [Gordonia phthalatica]